MVKKHPEQMRVRLVAEATATKLEQALNAGDYLAAASMYTEDAYLLAPQGKLVRGRTAIQSAWSAAREAGVVMIRLTVLEVEASGDLAYELGRAEVTYRSDHGAAGPTDGLPYLVVWKRAEDSVWRQHAGLFASEQAAALTQRGRAPA